MDALKLSEDAQLLLQIEQLIRKSYNENNKLQKQRGLVPTLSPVFSSHFVLKKQYVVSYIQAYDDMVNDVYIGELSTLLHPVMFKNGAFIISKYTGHQFPDRDTTAENGFSPLNSTPILNESANENTTFYATTSIQLPMKSTELVKCGTIFSAHDILGGGKREFQSTLGIIKIVTISLKKLKPLSLFDSRYMCAVYSQCLKLIKDRNDVDLGLLVLPCETSKILNVTATVCFAEYKNTDNLKLHILKIKNHDEKKPKMSMRACEETSYISTYDILGDLKMVSPDEMETSEQEGQEETSLNVEFHWTGGDSQMLQHPPHSAKTVLKLQVTAGEIRSAAHDVYLELTALDGIFNSSQSSSSDFTNSLASEIVHDKLVVFKEAVSDFSFYGTSDSGKHAESEKTDDLETPMSRLIQDSFQRNDHDFTDKLWMFLRQTESLDELRGYLDDILTDIVHGSLQPAISPTNDTKLGKYIRQMYLAQADDSKMHMKEKILEFLSSESSVQSLVSEIGSEKLRKDYFNFFISKELASASFLRKLFKQSSGQVDMEALWKLHYCLEIASTPAIYLNLAHDCQSTLLKAAVDYYSVNSVGTSSPIFCLSLLPFHDSSSSVHETCEARHAVSWQQGTIQMNKADMKETSVLHVATRDVLPEEDDVDIIPTQQDKTILSEEVIMLPFKCAQQINGH